MWTADTDGGRRMRTADGGRDSYKKKITKIILSLRRITMYSRTPVFRSPRGNGKKFEIAGFRNNRGSVKFVTVSRLLIKYNTL